MNAVPEPLAIVRFRSVAVGCCLAILSLGGVFGETACGTELRALIRDPRLAEISGIARSLGHPGQFWVHNDSGTEPSLYLIDADGKTLAQRRIDHAQSRDWEDIASFALGGVSGLLIADTGDNGGIREDVSLFAVREPAPESANQALAIAWQLRFRWPDGPRDVEAVAIDPQTEQILLISKKRVPAELWSLPLPAWHSDASQHPTPQRIGALSGIDQPAPDNTSKATPTDRYRAQITAADIDPTGRWLAVLTYQRVYLYERSSDQSWADAVQHAPRRLDFGWLPQAEAISFDARERAIWVTSERLPAPLLRLPF